MARIIEITDIRAPELDLYARLSEVQLRRYYEPKTGVFIAESPKVTERALDAGYTPLSFLVERKYLQGAEGNGSGRDGNGEEERDIPQREHTWRVLARCGDIPVYTADLPVLKELTGYPLTRGLLCAMRRRPLPEVRDVCAGTRRIAVLENITNPTNVGAIFRSAAALNMDAVLLTPGCSDPLYRRAVRVSMGTVFQIPWTFFPSGLDWPGGGMALLRELGFQTAALALEEDSIPLGDRRLKSAQKLAVILGAEGDGLAADTIADCDCTVRIPMSHGVDSLNVAAAAAVAFWELGRINP